MGDQVHICHITTVHPANDVRIFHKECTSLQKAGYRVSLIVANAESETLNGIEIIGVPVTYKSRTGRIRKAGKALLAKAMELDAAVYHFHDPEFLRFAKPLLAAGKKVVYDAHEDVPRQIMAKQWIPSLVRKSVSRRFEKFENAMAARLSAVVAATPFIRDRFLKVQPTTIDVCNYPILQEWQPGGGFARERTVCYIGGITRVRGIIEMVKAMEGADFRLQLAGQFATPELEAEVKEMPGWQQVDFHGYLDREGIALLLSRCTAGLVTLHPEINYLDALPVKMYEYMAAGIPVIASNFPLWKSIVEKYNCGVCVDPLQPADIRNGMASLLADAAQSEVLGYNGRRAIEEECNWDHESKKLIALYEQLTGQSTGKM